jgi:protein SCO1/2
MGVLRGERSKPLADLFGNGTVKRLTLMSFVALVFVAFLSGCGHEDGSPGEYAAHGIVEDVDPEYATVLIDHEDVDGLMPAMTMSFSVPDEEVLASLARGQVIDFEIRFTGRSYEVSEATVVGEASAEAGWRKLGDALVRTQPAPPFELTDQEGRAVSLDSFPDQVLIVDFIFTECPGPCPVQTSNQVAIQKQIPEALKSHIQFISISLDPATDRPAVMKAYAESRGADFSNWSFLTGEPTTVEALVKKWGVGSVRQPDGSIDHTLLTFLVDDQRVMDHYTPSEGQSEALLRDVEGLVRARLEAGTAGGQ